MECATCDCFDHVQPKADITSNKTVMEKSNTPRENDSVLSVRDDTETQNKEADSQSISSNETVMEKSNIARENGSIPSVRGHTETQNNGADSEDEFDAFGRSIIAQMRKLPEEYAVVLMSEIQTLLTRKRLRYIVDKRKPNVPQIPVLKQFPL